MAWQPVSYRLTSSSPLLMHNGQTADPTNKWAKAIKLISGKRKKTDADYEEMARLEFLAGLYMGADGPVLPSHMLEGMLIKSAMKSSEGPIAKSAVFCPEHARLEYEGPRDADGLWADERFRFSMIVRVQQSRVARMRPIFSEWSAVITYQIEPTLVNPNRIAEWLEVGGTQIGIGDWRPRYGRFEAKQLAKAERTAA